MSTYISKILNAPVPQSEPLREDQVQNSAGGFAWAVDDWARLERFLILGSEGGSYYASERKLTMENTKLIAKLAKEDGARLITTITAISQAGRAPKNTPALFALATLLCVGDEKDKAAVRAYLPLIARTGTHIMQFAEFVETLGGWGRAKRKAIAEWYTRMPAQKLAYQGIKYRQREGWTHADLLRLSHPKTDDPVRKVVFDWLCNGWPDIGPEPPADEAQQTIWAYEGAARARVGDKADKVRLISLIRQFNLPREAVPTEWLNDQDVWAALLERMPLTAMIRNLGKMTSLGLVAPNSGGAAHVQNQLFSKEKLLAARVHPLSILVALNTYALGHGVKGNLTWNPVQTVLDALDSAFYASFQNITPTGKRWYLGLDVSASMNGPEIAGMSGITPRIGSAAMALLTASVEKQWYMRGFTAGTVPGARSYTTSRYGRGSAIMDLDISPRMRLDAVQKVMERVPFGGTDCALPMLDALEQRIPVDVFVVYTDSETWAGDVHPKKALDMYREKMGIPARLIVVGMVSNGFSIADPLDAGMLDVVGFDTAAPAVMSDFATGGAAAEATSSAVSAQVE